MKPWLLCFTFALAALVASATHAPESAANPSQVILKYLGAAGWEITDGPTTVLIDPYLSRINGPAPPGGGSGHPIAGDTRRAYKWTDIAMPDIAAIDAHVQRADFVLVTHTHYDHVLDVPHIALKTRATVIGTESTENVMRASGVPEEQLITVRGGEDYQSPPPDERPKDSESRSQAGFGSCFSEIDTGASESFLLIKFIAA